MLVSCGGWDSTESVLQEASWRRPVEREITIALSSST